LTTLTGFFSPKKSIFEKNHATQFFCRDSIQNLQKKLHFLEKCKKLDLKNKKEVEDKVLFLQSFWK